MKQRKRAAKRVKKARNVKKTTKIEAISASGRRPRLLPDDLAGLYKPLKKPVTLRLDADILAFFQRAGRGYQTRINQALRRAVSEDRKKGRG